MQNEITGQYLNLLSRKIYYYTLGSGPTVLFIHGHRSDALRFKSTLTTLAKHAYVVAPDLPGCGQSPPYRGQWHTMTAYAQTLAEFVNALDLNEITLLGGSMGGLVALKLFPQIASRVSKVVLLITPADKSVWKPKLQKCRRYFRSFPFLIKTKIVPWLGDRIIYSDRLMNRLLTRIFDPNDRKPDIIEYEKKQWRQMSFSVWMQTNYSIVNNRVSDQPLKIHVPTLIVESKSNQYYNTEKNLKILKAIAPQHQVVIIPWKTHVPKGELSESFLAPYTKQLEEFISAR